jgi:hypothetical protein
MGGHEIGQVKKRELYKNDKSTYVSRSVTEPGSILCSSDQCEGGWHQDINL